MLKRNNAAVLTNFYIIIIIILISTLMIFGRHHMCKMCSLVQHFDWCPNFPREVWIDTASNIQFLHSIDYFHVNYLYYESFGPSIQAEKIREEEKEADEKEIIRLMKEQEDKNLEISSLEQKSQEYEHRLDELRNKIKELEVSSDSKDQKWNMKMNQIQTVINFQLSSLQVHLQMC